VTLTLALALAGTGLGLIVPLSGTPEMALSSLNVTVCPGVNPAMLPASVLGVEVIAVGLRVSEGATTPTAALWVLSVPLQAPCRGLTE